MESAQSTTAIAPPTTAASPTPANTLWFLEAADFACVAAPLAFATPLGMGIRLPLAAAVVIIVVLAFPVLLLAVPPVVPSIGEVLDWAFFARAAKASTVRDWFAAGLQR